MNLYPNLRGSLIPLQNCEAVVFEIFRLLKVPATRTTVKRRLEEHPDYPSLLAVSDVVKSYGVSDACAKVDISRLEDIPEPILAQLSIDSQEYFTVVYKVNESLITYLDPLTNKITQLSSGDFSRVFTGYILVPEAQPSSGEINYRENIKEENRALFSRAAMIFSIPICVLVECILIFIHVGSAAMGPIIYMLVSFAGAAAAALLIWHDVDQYNPTLRAICRSGSTFDCGAVLHSKASKILGINWSVIGFSYFGGNLISLLFAGIYNRSVLTALAWLNALTLPYIIFSIYYQARVVKQWCVLCLFVQACLLLQFVVAFFARFFQTGGFSSYGELVPLVFSFVIPLIIAALLVPALHKAREARMNNFTWRKLKYNSDVFQVALARQKSIVEPEFGLGITLGNPEAKYKIVKVCNPYCKPCSTSHAKLEALIHHNSEVSVQIIFVSSPDKEDIKYLPISHFMALDQLGDKELLERSLNDWYSSAKKDYAFFAGKYPVEAAMIQQDDKLEAMRMWCEMEEIESTPTIFVNKHRLPDEYDISDLQFILS